MPLDPLEFQVRRFAESECSWLSSVRPDGRVHAAPVWHIWLAGAAYVVTTADAVKTANIRANPNVVITHPDPVRALIIEGQAALVEEMEPMLRPYFKAKYDWDIAEDQDYSTVIKITPTRLIAWGDEGAGHRQRWSGADIARID